LTKIYKHPSGRAAASQKEQRVDDVGSQIRGMWRSWVGWEKIDNKELSEGYGSITTSTINSLG